MTTLFKNTAAVILCFMLSVSAQASVNQDASSNAYALDYPQPLPSDYIYRTERRSPPPPAKNIWDYLSFFTWRPTVKQKPRPRAAESRALQKRIADLARQLNANAEESIADEYVITVNTFVNLNSLYKTSDLGRYICEELIGDLQKAGIEVIDVRKSAGLMIKQRYGVYALSRNMNELSYIHNAQAMIVGTYTYAHNQIMLNARLLRNRDGMVLSHASLTFELDPVTRQMLADESSPPKAPVAVRIKKFDP